MSSFPRSSFGEIRQIQPYPLFQQNFSFNVNSRFWNTVTANTGTVTIVNRMVSLATGRLQARAPKYYPVENLKSGPDKLWYADLGLGSRPGLQAHTKL